MQNLIKTVTSILQDGFSKGIGYQIPSTMKRNLSENIYVFSGAKTYAELNELSGLLLDDSGKIKPFQQFWKEVQAIHQDYNKNYLEAEYIFATQSAQMATHWNDFVQDGDRYHLQYRTAGDERVRETHRILNNTTLPPSDPFWDQFFPPNGWRCRCTTVQVRKQKYPVSNTTQAQLAGVKATNGKNTIFRFNPGKQEVIFPKHHPYFTALSKAEKENLKQQARDVNDIKTAGQVVTLLQNIDKDKKWFERGFKNLEITQKAYVNGSTDLNGNIWLKKDRMDYTVSGINKLTKGEKINFEEADALATFWHEITHNRNKVGPVFKTHLQTRYMELANEFVARNTLPEFYQALGSKIQFSEFMTNRKSTGYNTMVRNYANLVNKTGLETAKVVDKVKEHLFTVSYDKQNEGLTKALIGAKKKDGTKLKKAEINSLVRYCDRMNEENFDTYLNEFIR